MCNASSALTLSFCFFTLTVYFAVYSVAVQLGESSLIVSRTLGTFFTVTLIFLKKVSHTCDPQEHTILFCQCSQMCSSALQTPDRD